MNKRYYINVKDLMDRQLPRPRRKHKVSILCTKDEWLPVIDGNTGKVMFI